jgi:hypothetical protein
MQSAAAADGKEGIAAACFPAAVAKLTYRLYPNLAAIMQTAAAHCAPVSSTGSSQPAASIALLAVVLARNMVQLADAMDAAGPQLLFESLMAKPQYALMWTAGEPGQVCHLLAFPFGLHPQHTVEVQWYFWQLFVLKSAQALVSTLLDLGLLRNANHAAGAEAAAAAGTGAVTDTHSTGGASSSSSSSSEQPKWDFLLRLQDGNPRWAAAAAAFDSVSLINMDLDTVKGYPGSDALEEFKQPYADALELCRALAAAAPLPVVCNNPSCENLGGVSEAAAASKACAGCRCRYCSAACQQVDWKRHKYACKRMAAAGEACV